MCKRVRCAWRTLAITNAHGQISFCWLIYYVCEGDRQFGNEQSIKWSCLGWIKNKIKEFNRPLFRTAYKLFNWYLATYLKSKIVANLKAFSISHYRKWNLKKLESNHQSVSISVCVIINTGCLTKWTVALKCPQVCKLMIQIWKIHNLTIFGYVKKDANVLKCYTFFFNESMFHFKLWRNASITIEWWNKKVY